MPAHKVFYDQDGQEMKIYRNNRGLLFIEVGSPEGDGYYSGHIVLTKSDAEELIEEIQGWIPTLEEKALEVPEN